MRDASYRRDIDGLRAVAVTAVVLFHAAHRFVPSGFVGVDIFFVISGYLIGGIIFAGTLERRFSFATFYARRARRILPALIAVVAATGLAALLLLNGQEAVEWAGQAGGALLGVSNLYFYKHTGYFATAAEQEPLLMTWSLGVEEQFYLLFPFLMIGVARLRRRRRFAVMLTGIALSFALSLFLTSRMPAFAFYLLPARAWELGVGALLAIVHRDAPHTAALHGRATEAIGAVSAIGLVASLLVFDGDTAFPGAAALLPVLATAGLIQARHSAVNRLVLGSPPFVAIGLISYSWYLWHWPLMAFARRAADAPPAEDKMLLIALASLLIGAVSWKWVEQPFRAARRPDGATLWRYGIAVAGALALPVAFKLSGGLPGRLSPEVRRAEAVLAEARGDCLPGYGETALPVGPHCLPPHAAIALIGDSHAAALGPGLLDGAARQGLAVARLTKSSCTPLPGFAPVILGQPRHPAECETFRQAAIARIVADPDIRVVVASAYWRNLIRLGMVRVDGGAAVDPRIATREGLRTLVATLRRAGKRVVIVGDVPGPGFVPPDRMMSAMIPARRRLADWLAAHDQRRSDGTFDRYATEDPRGVTDAFLAEQARALGVGFLAPADQFCAGRTCRYADGTTPLFIDSHHLTAAASRRIDWRAALAEQVPRR